MTESQLSGTCTRPNISSTYVRLNIYLFVGRC